MHFNICMLPACVSKIALLSGILKHVLIASFLTLPDACIYAVCLFSMLRIICSFGLCKPVFVCEKYVDWMAKFGLVHVD